MRADRFHDVGIEAVGQLQHASQAVGVVVPEARGGEGLGQGCHLGSHAALGSVDESNAGELLSQAWASNAYLTIKRGPVLFHGHTQALRCRQILQR